MNQKETPASAGKKSRIGPLVFGGLLVPALALILGFALAGAPRMAAADAAAPDGGSDALSGGLVWSQAAPGLELGLGMLAETRSRSPSAMFVVLRFTPSEQDLTLEMAREKGASLSPAGWCREAGLRAGINASMYLPDKVTSTGYMRKDAVVNNSHVGTRLGAFFVARPRLDGLPAADIINRGSDGWEQTLDAYAMVVQNYRILGPEGRLLWKGKGEKHSIAALGKDRQGRMLFLLCQEPVSVERFVDCLNEFGLEPSALAYVEGGRQAALFLRIRDGEDEMPPPDLTGAAVYPLPDGKVYVWRGRRSPINTPGNPDGPVPNVIGLRMQ
ncbi:phosphodiester glycosidase family protein [Desulfovibrio sp. OttesenSCG-928-A18]|nr:phosphodiester glycosidase family protein [Desulfovibrio sp. OttesenSCG-928-A18]